jgi:hypothetical protein
MKKRELINIKNDPTSPAILGFEKKEDRNIA